MDDWVSACSKVEVAGARYKERKRKIWKECVDIDMKVIGLYPENLNRQYSGMCGGSSYGQTCNPCVVWKKWTFSK